MFSIAITISSLLFLLSFSNSSMKFFPPSSSCILLSISLHSFILFVFRFFIFWSVYFDIIPYSCIAFLRFSIVSSVSSSSIISISVFSTFEAWDSGSLGGGFIIFVFELEVCLPFLCIELFCLFLSCLSPVIFCVLLYHFSFSFV